MSLPTGFSELEGFVSRWALSSPSQRVAARQGSTIEALREFADAMVPRLDEVLAYLDGLGSADLGGADMNLFLLVLSLSELSRAVELYDSPSPAGLDESRFVMTACPPWAASTSATPKAD